MQIMKQIQVLNQLQSKGHYESAVFMQKIRDLTEQLKLARGKNVMQQLKENKTLERIKKLIKIIERGPERMEVLDTELFTQMIERVVVFEDRTITFYLSGGFYFEEMAK